MTEDFAQLPSRSEAQTVTYRPGKPADTGAIFKVFTEAMFNLHYRNGQRPEDNPPTQQELTDVWGSLGSLFKHLEQTGDYFWVAERSCQIVGYARSTLRDGLLELTELFVSPNVQAKGVGRQLLARAFPHKDAEQRLIIATMDLPAQARYLKAGVYPLYPAYTFEGKPKPIEFETDLEFQPIGSSPDNLETLARLDKTLLGHRRDLDHEWLLSDRQGYLYRRDGETVGYGYIGHFNGPFALQDPTDFPAILSHLENQSLDGNHNFGIDIPMANRAAVRHMLSRGFRISPFIIMIMVDHTQGKFENYILTSPPFFL